MSSKTDIELKYCPNQYNFSNIKLHYAKIHERNATLLRLEGYLVSFWVVRASPIILKIKFERVDIESNIKYWHCAALGTAHPMNSGLSFDILSHTKHSFIFFHFFCHFSYDMSWLLHYSCPLLRFVGWSFLRGWHSTYSTFNHILLSHITTDFSQTWRQFFEFTYVLGFMKFCLPIVIQRLIRQVSRNGHFCAD